MKNHAGFECEGFFSLRPVILLAHPPRPPQAENDWTTWLPGLLNDPRFTEGWRYGTVTSQTSPGIRVTAFFSRQFLDRIEVNGAYHFNETMMWRSNKWVEVTGGGPAGTSPSPLDP